MHLLYGSFYAFRGELRYRTKVGLPSRRGWGSAFADVYAEGEREAVLAHEGRFNKQSWEKAPEPNELVVLDGSAHAQYLFQTDAGERVMRAFVRSLTAK